MSNGASRGLSQEDASGDGEQDRYNNEPRSHVWLRPKKPRTEKNNGHFISADALVLNQRAEPLTESVTHLMSELYLRYFPRT